MRRVSYEGKGQGGTAKESNIPAVVLTTLCFSLSRFSNVPVITRDVGKMSLFIGGGGLQDL